MANLMYFGVPGSIQTIRCPNSGMEFVNNLDMDTQALVSGARSIYRAPLTYKTYSMSWSAGSAQLKHLIDTYNGQYGSGPYYLLDPVASPRNVLPARWSNAWQLAYQANGWCKPFVVDWPIPAQLSTNYRTPYRVTFTQQTSATNLVAEGVLRTRVIREPGKQYFFAAKGVATGGAGIRIRGYDKFTGAWVLITTFTTLTGAPSSVIAAAQNTYDTIELDVYMPAGSTLMLYGLSLGTEDFSVTTPGEYMPVGQGVGPVNFSSTQSANLVSAVIDRVGLSLDFTEVQNVESRMM